MPRLNSLRSPKRRTLHKKRVVWLVIAFIIAAVSICSAVLLFLNSYFVRISSVSIEGGNGMQNDQVQSIIYNSLVGDYFWFIPKDSTFLFPSSTFLRIIPAEFPAIADISFSHSGSTGIVATITDRIPYAIACLNSSIDDCYYTDENGVIFEAASSTEGAFTIYYISLPAGAKPLGLQFIDSGRLTDLAAFVGGLSELGFIDEGITISTSTNYDLALEYQKNGSPSTTLQPYNPTILSTSSSPPLMHLFIDESRPFPETFEDFSAFWQEYSHAATTSTALDLSLVDMRYGDNIIYKIK